MKRQDRLCRCGQVLPLLGNDMVEIGDDCAEHPEAPEIVPAGYRCWNASHQEKPGDFGCRCPGSDASFGFIIEQLFTPQSRTVILPERGGEFTIAEPSQQCSAMRAWVANLVDTAVRRFGRTDVLINNADIMPLSALESLKVDEWDRVIDVNIKGVLYGIAAALPHMKAQKSGHVSTTASVAGHLVFPASSVYSGTKFAVRAICEGFRQEVKNYNIRTTILCPGAVKTEWLDHISDEDVRDANRDYVENVGILWLVTLAWWPLR